MTGRMDPTDPVEARLLRLRDVTAEIVPSPDFAARVVAACACVG